MTHGAKVLLFWLIVFSLFAGISSGSLEMTIAAILGSVLLAVRHDHDRERAEIRRHRHAVKLAKARKARRP